MSFSNNNSKSKLNISKVNKSLDTSRDRLSKSVSKSPRPTHSSGFNIIRGIINKQEDKLSSLQAINRDSVIPIKLEDSNIVFDEVDMNKSGTVSIDELFQYVVDKMAGLPQTQRTQVNKSLRKVQKQFQTEEQQGQGLDRMTFWKMMQFIFQWFLIYMKFNKYGSESWVTDEKTMREAGMWNLVEGKNFKDKLDHLTKGRRTDVATFQDWIDQQTDIITYSIEARDRQVVESMNEYEHLKMRLQLLESKCREQQGYLRESEIQIASLKKTDDQLTNYKEENNKLITEKENLRYNIKQFTNDQNSKVEDLQNKISKLESENLILIDEKNQSLVTFNNLINDLKTSMIEERKKLELRVENLNEENQRIANETKSLEQEKITLADTMSQLEGVIQKMHKDQSDILNTFNEFKNSTNAEREDLLKVINNAEKNSNEQETSYLQEKSKNEILQSQVNSQNQSLKNLENNQLEIKSDLSKTMEELRHQKQGMHESENSNKEKQNDIDSLKETIKTLNNNMIEVKSNYESQRQKQDDLQKRSNDFDTEIRKQESQSRKEKGTIAQQDITIKKLRAELQELNEKHSHLNNDYREQNLSLESLKIENNRYKGEIVQLENRNITSDVSSNAFNKVTEIQNNLIGNSNTEELVKKTEQKYINNLRTLSQTQIKNINQDVDVQINQLSEKDGIIQSLKERLNNNDIEKQKLKDKLLSMKNHVSKEYQDELFSKQEEIKDKLSFIEKEKNELGETLTKHNTKILNQNSDLQKYHKNYSDEAHELRERIKKSENQSNLDKMNFNTISNENTILSKQIAELTKRISSLEFDRKEHLSKIENLNNSLDEMKLKNTQLEHDQENMQHKQSQMSKEFADLDENRAREFDMQEDMFRRSVVEDKDDDNLNSSKILKKDLNISRIKSSSIKDNDTKIDIADKLKQFQEQRSNNGQPVKLKFVKIKEGLQKWGNKTLNLKTLSGGILVRVGGGWTDINEQYEKHEENELNAIENAERRLESSPSQDFTVVSPNEETNGNSGSQKPMEFAKAQSLKKNILSNISKKIYENRAMTQRND